MVEFILQLNCCFTDEDKEKCKATVYRIVELATLARAQGILRLETEMGQEENFFLKTGIRLVTDGRTPETVKQVLQNMILADKYTGWQLLDRLLIAEGVLAIQKGEAPYIIQLMLSSMLGEKYIQPITEDISKQADRVKNYFNFLGIVSTRKALPESKKFEAIILSFDNRSLQNIIRFTDGNCLIMALNGCGAEVIYKVLNNVSMTTALQICENMKETGMWQQESAWAQSKVFETIEALTKQGDIVRINWQ